MPTLKKVVYLGPEFTFSHEAALQIFPKAHCFFELRPIEIFHKVDSGEYDYGILPVENSTTGVVHEFFSLLVNQPFGLPRHSVNVHITNELFLPITHHLLSKSQLPLVEISTLYTHQQPYLQSLQWVDKHLPDVTREFTESTTVAADRLNQAPKGACIGSDFLAKRKGLYKIRDTINDNKMNMTRFVAVSSKHKKILSKTNKSTFCMMIPDRIGSLVAALQLISTESIAIENIKMIPAIDPNADSRIFKDWFVLDVSCGHNSEQFLSLKAHMHKEQPDTIRDFKLLGSYKSGWRDDYSGHIKIPGATEATPEDMVKFVAEMIKNGETERVEFKSSLRFDYRTRGANRELPVAIAKSMTGFMNSKGGYLLIGVSDSGEVLGLENDIQTLSKKSIDGFRLALYQTLSDMIGKEHAQSIHPVFVKIGDKEVCCIRVDATGKAAWLKDKDTEVMYIRVGVSAKPLNSREASEYILSRFPIR